MKELPKAYNPAEHEEAIYKKWEASGAFAPKPAQAGEKTYAILMPPPNANGALHVGHGVPATVQDLLVRFHRMRGDATVWFPGLDHAGFETQVVFEKYLEKQGKSRFDLSREELYDQTLAFTKENSTRILDQLKRLGVSADWSRLFFTLDDDIVAQVYATFVKLYEDGLAYRDARPVNWCPKHQTTLSDLETKDEVRTDPLYTLTYGPLQVATGRPETIFADVAVAVHPDDPRFARYVGTTIEVDFGIETRAVPVVADGMVDPTFGTGAVKITPAHDPNDFEVAKRHTLPMDRVVIDERGKLTELAGPFAGLKAEEARAQVVELLRSKNLITAAQEDYQHAVKVCYKCGRTIEPRVIKQWFIAMTKPGTKTGKNLTKLALDAVAGGQTKFVTRRFEKIFRHWLANIHDWPVSRQIVWGIRLPVWYRAAKGGELKTQNSKLKTEEEIYVGVAPPKGEGWEQDTDTFDTWFSSGQLPVVVLKRPKFADDFARFYPTAVMETGWEIIFFWVARMLMFGLYLTGKVPFRDIYLHGIVRDKDRQKMSKSKGNVIDPLGVVNEHGADALRMALIFGTAAGNDMPMSEEKIRGMRNFTNKLWNISRFILMNLDGGRGTEDGERSPQARTEADRMILEQLDRTIVAITQAIEAYRFHEAAQALYHFVWDEFAAVYVEASKAQLVDQATKASTQAILHHGLIHILKLAHPFMPFVTEAVWQHLPKSAKDHDMLMVARWPTASEIRSTESE